MYFSYNIRDNLPLHVPSTEQSPEIKSVLSCILKKEEIGSWFRVGGGVRGGEGKLRKEAKCTDFQKLPYGFLPACILSCALPPHQDKTQAGHTVPPPHSKGAHSPLRTRT